VRLSAALRLRLSLADVGFINLIIPRDRIEAVYDGGWDEFASDNHSVFGRRIWFDDHLMRDGAMSPGDMGLYRLINILIWLFYGTLLSRFHIATQHQVFLTALIPFPTRPRDL